MGRVWLKGGDKEELRKKRTGDTVTPPPTVTGTFRAPGLASAPVPTVDVPWAQTFDFVNIIDHGKKKKISYRM